MTRKILLAAALLLAGTHLASAQTQPAKVKVKSKPGRAAKIPTPPAAAEAPATDWLLTYASTITPEDLRRHLSVLASDEYESRETGQKGQKMAAEYLSKQFAELGLSGPVKDSDNPYIQYFTLNRVVLDPASSVKIGNRTFVVNQDFYLLLRDAATASASVQPAFVGYGISTAGYADFAPGAASLKDQHLVMLLGEPLTKTSQPLLGKASQPSPYGTGGVAEMTARSPAVRSLAPRATFRIAPSAAAFAQVPQAYKAAQLILLSGDMVSSARKSRAGW